MGRAGREKPGLLLYRILIALSSTRLISPRKLKKAAFRENLYKREKILVLDPFASCTEYHSGRVLTHSFLLKGGK